ncbi:cellulase family glycosylhydrolase [Halorussus halophilus]|uniref:cellulase family glycosylhydrolase n=1 Tax=Halorussus halophilus TaxID=2650975 RepID=UPI001300FFD6|nr:cellulase family glycosylhydrolase [Halorussus halophilus]
MTERVTRREFLGATGVASVGVLGTSPLQESSGPPVDVRGAIYLPTRVFNWYQLWHDYDESVIERDLGYAARVNLNAIRLCCSYEFWVENPKAHERRLDHLLSAADEQDIEVLVCLFESVGLNPNEENLTNRDPLTATPVQSPSRKILLDSSRWGETREFVRWFAERYGDDDRLLAIEVMNEPGWLPFKEEFAKSMFFTLRTARPSVPLTVGSTSLANNVEYTDWGSDVLQFHYNFASSRETYRRLLRDANHLADSMDCPIWLTEWQRCRSGQGFEAEVVGDEWQPNYASLAPEIRKAGVGNFFWSLMVKPAYVHAQRDQGVLGGLFHEDGAVWSLEDARGIQSMSGEVSFSGEERREWPEWALEVREEAFGGE